MSDIFHDPNTSPDILSQLVWDRHFLLAVYGKITESDFRNMNGDGNLSWLVAATALLTYKKYKTPIGDVIFQEFSERMDREGSSDERRKRVGAFLKALKSRYDPAKTAMLQDRALGWKKERLKEKIIRDWIGMLKEGDLTDDAMMKMIRECVESFYGEELTDWTEGMEDRISRRAARLAQRRIPTFCIDPLDALVRGTDRGEIGLWVAPLKEGKSVTLIWMATAYLKQGLHVMYVPLEDRKDIVEDRIDASMMGIINHELAIQTPMLRERWKKFKNQYRNKLKILDGASKAYSIADIEAIYDRERARGFVADAVIIDYDKKIRPPRWRKEGRRFEFEDIYTEYGRFLARTQTYGWTASQSNREGIGKRNIESVNISEALDKGQQATVVLGLGRGKWAPKDPNCKRIWVSEHRNDRKKVGCDIFSDLERNMLYDRDRTIKFLRDNPQEYIGGIGED